MNVSWLATTAVALVIGTGAVIAQSQTEQKREEAPPAQQKPSKSDTERGDRQQDRKVQSDPRGAKDQGAPPSDRKQTQDQQPRDTKQPAQQGQDQKDRGDRPATAQGQEKRDRAEERAPQQSKDQQKSRDTNQQAEPTQQGRKQRDQARDAKQPRDPQQTGETGQQKKDSQARDSKQRNEPKQTGQQQPSQANQPSTTTTQQGTRPNDTQPVQTRDRATTESSRTGTSASVNIDDRQRTEVIDRLRRDRSASSRNINIDVTIGVRLPSRARVRPLPQDIVRIMPQYRGYQYTIVEDEVVVVEPRTRRVVEIIREPGSSTSVRTNVGSGSNRISISSEHRETLRQSARRMTTAPTSAGSGSLSETSCLQLQAIPDDVTRSNPELGSYRMLAIGSQIVLIDPREQKIVEVIE